ncbi:hypothetical protein HY375_03135 [Candidatus Berkelbacteria bacterium]|nr:hypothetical protein [Candidatus Berkelbacteria bacterium]
MLSRRLLLQAGGVALLEATLPQWGQASPLLVRPKDAFGRARLQAKFGDTHAHCRFCDGEPMVGFSGHITEPALVAQAGLATNHYFLITPHAEQLSTEDVEVLVRLSAQLEADGQLFDWGMEWTGIPDEGSPAPLDPAYVKAGGHVLILRSSETIGHHVQGGEPQVRAGTYRELLDRVVERPWMQLVFPHPELYGVETTWDGFAPPPDARLIRQGVGCELSSHGPRGYQGPGDVSKGVRASNEAGWRLLLRRRWRPGPFGSTDRHLYPYEPGPWTVAFLETPPHGRPFTIDHVYQAFAGRRVCFSEAAGAYARLVGWFDEVTTNVALMGDTIAPRGHRELWVAADLESPVPVESIQLIVVAAEEAQDITLTTSRLDVNPRAFGDVFSVLTLKKLGAVAVYAKVRLADRNHSQLVTAPLFLEW